MQFIHAHKLSMILTLQADSITQIMLEYFLNTHLQFYKKYPQQVNISPLSDTWDDGHFHNFDAWQTALHIN
jgi:hypothetical protein